MRRLQRVKTMGVFLGIFGGLFLLVSGVMVQAQIPSSGGEKVAKVVASPDSFYGSQITLTSNVEAIVGVSSFVIDNPGVTGGKVLVIGDYPASGAKATQIRVDDKVKISGRVQNFDVKKLEKEFGTDLPEDVFINWQGRPVITADSVTKG